MLIDGKIKSIRTKSKAEDEGNVLHLTTVTAEFEDLDRAVLDEMAFAEHFKRILTMELHGVKTPTTLPQT
jgi:superfamily II helicase